MMFSIIQITSACVITFFNFSYCYKHGLTKLKSFLMAAMTTLLCWISIFLLSWVCNEFQGFGTQNAVRFFPVYPLIVWGISKWFNIDFRELCDRYAPSPVLAYSVAHVACIFAGCCHGFEYDEGTTMYKIAHALTDTNMLPQQIIESLTALITAMVIWGISVKKKQSTGGRLLFCTLIAYGVQRFLFEFLRDNEKLFVIKEMSGAVMHGSGGAKAYWGISELAIWALIMVVEGIIFLIAFDVIDKKKAKQAELQLKK